MAANPSQPPEGSFLNQNDDSNDNCTPKKGVNSVLRETNNNNIGYYNENVNEHNVLEDTERHTDKPSCTCTNIGIMHLFHEMKQEFPTIPDTIVAQCVNENCHQRENCVQILRNELVLNPVPAQSYPAKVLQQQRQQQQQQQQHNSQLEYKTNKPIRAAPVVPPNTSPVVQLIDTTSSSPQLVNSTPKDKVFPFNSVKASLNKQICDRLDVANGNSSSGYSSVKLKDVTNSFSVADNSNNIGIGDCVKAVNTNTSDMPATKIIALATQHSSKHETKTPTSNTNGSALETPLSAPPQHPPRARPTTLNLQSQQQQQQRQQLNVQLQKHFQQRQQPLQKPLRKAPLPPIPPKPSQLNSPAQVRHGNSSVYSQQSSCSNESSLASPISSGESEISVNVSVSSPTIPAHHNQLKSPIRHRSVIKVHPEPPYTRDFLASPTSSNGGSCTSGDQKSFTSVNLTLRQPVGNSVTPPSTIDISAGPCLGGTGGGLTYSSTSYDARRGYQKNFHITVTNEGGVFNASRIRPRSAYHTDGEHEEDGPTNGQSGGINPLRTTASADNVLEQRPFTVTSQQQQQEQHRYNDISNNSLYDDMCMSKESGAFSETLQRQKARRDKLATALRDNKKRLSQLEQEINVLTDPLSPGESARLDGDIQRLRCDCEAMLNEIEYVRRVGNSAVNTRQLQWPQQQTQPQPFPRQRPPRPPPPTSLTGIPQHLDFVQRHSNATITPTSTLNSPNYPHQLLQQQQQHPRITTSYQQYQPQLHAQMPTTYQQQQLSLQQQQALAQQYLPPPNVEEDCSDSNTDGGEDDDEDPQEMWACNMCTFRNHPQLNICECCENVRILPGTIRIVPASAAGTAPSAAAVPSAITNSPNTSLDNDANLTQQQLQQYALPT